MTSWYHFEHKKFSFYRISWIIAVYKTLNPKPSRLRKKITRKHSKWGILRPRLSSLGLRLCSAYSFQGFAHTLKSRCMYIYIYIYIYL